MIVMYGEIPRVIEVNDIRVFVEPSRKYMTQPEWCVEATKTSNSAPIDVFTGTKEECIESAKKAAAAYTNTGIFDFRPGAGEIRKAYTEKK